MSAAMMLASCGGTKDAGQNGTLIERSDIKIEGKRMTPEALWAMGRIGSVAVSPDEKQIVYSVAYYSVPENKSNNELFVMNADGSSNRQITRDSWQESQPVWIKDGKKIAFLCNESGSSQVWEMNPDGTERKQLTRYEISSCVFPRSPRVPAAENDSRTVRSSSTGGTASGERYFRSFVFRSAERTASSGEAGSSFRIPAPAVDRKSTRLNSSHRT